MRKPKVFIGVGHGGVDTGAVGCNGIERDINLIIATELKRILNENGVRAKRSRASNKVHDTVQEEVEECNKYSPDVTVEIHMNASATHKGFGFEEWVFSDEGFHIASCIMMYINNLPIYSRGIKYSRALYYTKNTKAPAVLIEGAFVDNYKDAYWCGKDGCKKLAEAYAKGIIKYLKEEKLL